MGGDMSLMVQRIKEALLMKKKEQAEDLREELVDMLEAIENWKY